MVKITEIRNSGSAVYILIDTGELFRFTHSDLEKSAFVEGMTYDPEIFFQQVRTLQYPHALNVAVTMLARRPSSRGEILSRLLQKHYSDEVSSLVICKLEKENLLDDEEFCEQWIRFRTGRGIGRSRIYYELKMKGVAEEVIHSALNRLDENTEKETALRLAEKAWQRISSTEDKRKSRQKVIASLVRKGYSWETARSACEKAEMKKE